MLILAKNLKHLREEVLKISQQKLADKLLVTRSSYEKYENDKVQPSIETLLRISKLYHISVDILLTVEISKYPLDELLQLPNNRILLPVLIDNKGDNKIEIIPSKASMGYLNGYNEPEYIESLQNISLPFLRNGKYRAFPVEGDSMPPFKDGTFIIGRYIEKISEMKVNKTYLLVTRSGFVYKRLAQINENSIQVLSDNSFYEPYQIPFYDLLEIWEYEYSLLKDYDSSDFSTSDIKEMFSSLKEDMKEMKKHFTK